MSAADTLPGPFVVHTGFGFLRGEAVLDASFRDARTFADAGEAETVARSTLGRRSRSAGNTPVTQARVYQFGRYTEAGTVAVVR